MVFRRRKPDVKVREIPLDMDLNCTVNVAAEIESYQNHAFKVTRHLCRGVPLDIVEGKRGNCDSDISEISSAHMILMLTESPGYWHNETSGRLSICDRISNDMMRYIVCMYI